MKKYLLFLLVITLPGYAAFFASSSTRTYIARGTCEPGASIELRAVLSTSKPRNVNNGIKGFYDRATCGSDGRWERVRDTDKSWGYPFAWVLVYPPTTKATQDFTLYAETRNNDRVAYTRWQPSVSAPSVPVGGRITVSVPIAQIGRAGLFSYGYSVTAPECVTVSVDPVSYDQPLRVTILGLTTCIYNAIITVTASLD